MPQLELSAAAGLAPGELFHDPTFPAGGEALTPSPNDVYWSVSWKRPHELRERPRLFVDGASRADVQQGGLGDCWFLSACIAVAQHAHLIRKIIPQGQVLYGDGYNGMLTFRFWRLSHWETIQIDDRLPVDENDRLIYSSAADPDEFWVPLIEKAFAKFHGGYDNLIGGHRMEGLISLTGYIVEECETVGWDDGVLFNLLESETQRDSLVTCSSQASYRKGLAGDHVYTVTGARRVRTRSGDEVQLLRVRNPWGSFFGSEWTGLWSDGDPRWNEIDQSTKDSMQFKKEEDGEFWMEESDFAKFFDRVTFAMETPLLAGAPMDDIENLHVLRASWEKGVSAGGSQRDMKMFATNPQFSLIVKDTDDSYIEGNELVDYCNVVLEIIQEDNRQKYRNPDGIALFIYKAERPPRRLTADELASRVEFGEPASHEARSAVLYRLELPPGAFVLVASAFDAGRSRDFVLRSYSRRHIALRRL